MKAFRILILLILAIPVFAQEIPVDVNNFSDQQIAQLMVRYQLQGKTSDEISQVLKEKGVPADQIILLNRRIASLDPRLEQAAMDLYANELETFRKVTLPLVAPGIAGAALLAFSLSFDDFIITNFNSGTLKTFPEFVYTSAARGIPAQANVIGSAMFILALLIVIAGQFVGKKVKVSK